MNIETLYELYRQYPNITTDSRCIEKNTLFFALKGEHFDGNTFTEEALKKGAAYCIIDNPDYQLDKHCILVNDVLKTLQELALHHRKQLTIPIIGITGTNGKTTTKELVHAVLSKKYRTHATKGNFNNHLGVPLTLLTMPFDSEIAIIEMGANHPGEIDFLCNIALPDFGLITNVGKAHLEGFGSFEGVVQTKTELYRFIENKKGLLFVNADNDMLMQKSEHQKRITYGSAPHSNSKGALVNANPYMKFYFENGDTVYSVQSRLLGGYNFDNAMAAVCIGAFFHVELFDIKEALEHYVPTNNRSQFKQSPNNQLILDCYNANPSSMKVAVENFGKIQASNRMVILGGMKELGADSEKEHRILVDLVKQIGFEKSVFVGSEFSFVQTDTTLQWFSDAAEAKKYYTEHSVINNFILLKGSNSSRIGILEDIL